MIPKLFPANATDFTTNGLGALRDAKSCKVTEERNGIYELSMTYYTTGQHYEEIQNECLIVAPACPGGTPQAFYIENIVDNLDGTVEILAKHISYRASYVPITPFSATGIQAAIAGIKSHELEASNFTLWTDIVNTETKYQQNTLKSLRACLGGTEDSLLDVYSSRGTGEFEWDNFNIKFHFHRGQDRGYSIKYRKNLSDLSKEVDSTDVATGCVAYWIDPETGVSFYGEIQHSSIYDTYPIKKTIIVDASEDFAETPTLTQLNTYAAAYVSNLDVPKESTDVEFYDEDQDVRLCDTVGVHYEIVNGDKVVKTIDYKAKVIKTVFDVISERFTKITIGDNTSDLASTLEKMNEEAREDAVSAVNTKIVSVYQYVDEEVGEVTTAVASVEEIASDSLDEVRILSSRVTQNESSITNELTAIQNQIVEYQSDVSNEIDTKLATQSTQFNNRIDETALGITQTISQIQTIVDENGEELDKYEDYITIDNSINGITIGKANSAIRGKFDNDSLDFINQNDETLAWLAAEDGLGANMLSVGSTTNRAQRWNIITSSDGNRLKFTRHQ